MLYSNIYHEYTPNVSIYSIHGSYGISNPKKIKKAKQNWLYHQTTWIELEKPMDFLHLGMRFVKFGKYNTNAILGQSGIYISYIELNGCMSCFISYICISKNIYIYVLYNMVKKYIYTYYSDIIYGVVQTWFVCQFQWEKWAFERLLGLQIYPLMDKPQTT